MHVFVSLLRKGAYCNSVQGIEPDVWITIMKQRNGLAYQLLPIFPELGCYPHGYTPHHTVTAGKQRTKSPQRKPIEVLLEQFIPVEVRGVVEQLPDETISSQRPFHCPPPNAFLWPE